MKQRSPRAASPARSNASPPKPVEHATRVQAIDALRGGAILAMIAYHFAYDLRFFGLAHFDFEHDPFWLTARALIVSTFLLLVGVSLVLATSAGVGRPRMLRRIGVIAASAAVVSAASYLLDPRTFIHFGILHGIAVAALLAMPWVHRPRAAVVAGIAIVVAGVALAHPFFDSRWTSWVGFTTHRPTTQDYVPLFPWLGVVMIGIGAAHLLLRHRFAPLAALGRAPRWLLLLGRHSLLIYMVHQPILLGILWLALRAK